jgi:hypothetical protein
MKKLLFAVSALAALSLLAPSTGFAQHMYDNTIGLYTTPNGLGVDNTGTNQIGAPVNVYMVLAKPAAMDGTPFTGITAFDCQLNFNPIGGIFVTGNALNGEGFNIGDVGSIDLGFLEFIVGFAAEVPVDPVDGSLLLVTLQFINSNVEQVDITMSPASIPSIPGTIGFLPGDPPLIEMFPSSGSLDTPVFSFNATAVAVEDESFGSVKALYR